MTRSSWHLLLARYNSRKLTATSWVQVLVEAIETALINDVPAPETLTSIMWPSEQKHSPLRTHSLYLETTLGLSFILLFFLPFFDRS